MKLQVGERLEGAGPEHQPGGYVVTSVVRETPWFGLYAGKKIFYNFDFTAKRVRETDDVEWLDVLLRTNRYPILDDPTYVQQRRALARSEVRSILGNRHSNLWPEPLDLLEIENTRDPFAFARDAIPRDAEPIVVYTRPHGEFTPAWQQKILPISSILSVLAELLEFMQQAHAEGLLLLGLGPTSLLIDPSDRVHYVGTDMVLAQQSTLLKESTPATIWQRLFPADRFPRGHAAPECFDPAQRPDLRADLYSWAALAFNLLTGIDLGKLALEQGRPFASFADAHWAELEKVLAPLPKNSVQSWADQIGVDSHRLLTAWPTNLLSAFRLLLSPDPALRPRSTAELRTWLVNPPPSPIAGLIALHTDADVAKLLLDCTGADRDLEMRIQCAQSIAPRQTSDGEIVAYGPLRPIVGINQLPLTAEPIYYTVFTRRKNDAEEVYSPGVTAQLWQPNAANLRQWVEEQSVNAFDTQQIPICVGMVFGALDVRATTESLLGSPIARVRAWALRRLEQVVRTQGFNESLETLLWCFVADPNAELRQSAATTLWTHHPQKSDDLLLRLMEALEAPPLDAPIPLMQLMTELQIPDDRIRIALKKLEARRPTECPLCQKPITLTERAAHLQTEHGYLFYQGDLMPAPAVFAKLWERAFQQHDLHAHEELADMYLALPEARSRPTAAVQQYVNDLQRFLLGDKKSTVDGKKIPVALPYASIMAYQTNLRLSKLFLPIVQQLLRSPQRRLRELGSQTVLPFLQEQLRPQATPGELRRLLSSICDDYDQIDLQIELCRQLGQHGVEQSLVNACIAQLQDERLVVCPECSSEVRARDLELHLRRAHQVFQFRGVRKTYVNVRQSILQAVCTSPPDLAAWKSLRSLAEDKHPEATDRHLVGWLYQCIKDMDVEQRQAAIVAVAEVVVAAESADRLLPYFAGPSKNSTWESLGQRFALEICARLPAALNVQMMPLILPFLDQKDLPRRSRENAVLALLRSVSANPELALGLLRAYIAQSNKKRGMEKLQHLEQRFGHSQAIDALTQELDGETRMSCPRCPTELRKKEMIPHLWDKHHLVLDGQRVREPWRVLEDWVVDYGLEKDPQVLQRCRELALKDDPQTGLARLQRLLYRHGLRDRELLNDLRASVKTRKATLCPHCCATVPIADPPVVQPLTLERSLLKGYGYHLEVAERGLVPSLQIESPTAILFQGREPGRGLTRLGGMLLVSIPLMLIAYGVLRRIIGDDVHAGILAGAALSLGLLGAGLTYAVWRRPRPAKARLVNAAWNILVPHMLREDLGRREWGFLFGLTEVSEKVRHHELNSDLLLECCEEASEAARNDSLALTCLARLSRRCLADMRDAGATPHDFVRTLAGECFKGKLPLSFLGELLQNFDGPDRATWSKSDLNSLPILVAQQAFAAEVDLDDWFNLGRAFPVVHAVLNLESRWHWLQFHALWSRHNRRPWENAGPAISMLELVQSPAEYEELLSNYPDVLLFVRKANLAIGSKGVWIEGVCVTSYRLGVEVSIQRTNGYEIVIGTQRIRSPDNPQVHLEDIKRWLRWYFLEFVPTVPASPRPMAESRHRMWQLGKIACPECGKPLAACPGDLGVALR